MFISRVVERGALKSPPAEFDQGKTSVITIRSIS
jgi:hypothetical protein